MVDPFVTRLGMVMHHHELEFNTKQFLCYVQGQGHSEGLYDPNVPISTISSELVVLLQPNVV